MVKIEEDTAVVEEGSMAGDTQEVGLHTEEETVAVAGRRTKEDLEAKGWKTVVTVMAVGGEEDFVSNFICRDPVPTVVALQKRTSGIRWASSKDTAEWK